MHKLKTQIDTPFDPCGIEVSARTLSVRLQVQGQPQPQHRFENAPRGHQALLRYLRRFGRPVRVCLEASGRYGLDLALALHQAQVPVMVANPRAIRHFAQALMQRSKNDALDTDVLCQFAARMPFQPWRPPSPTALKLVALARRLEELTEMAAAEKNRQHAYATCEALPRVLRLDVARSIAHHQQALQRLTEFSQELIFGDPGLRERYTLLLTIPGFGATSALHVLAELTLLAPDLDVRQWVASAGLDPREYTSGTSVHKTVRISKAGNAHLRHALYMPALVAATHDPHLRAFYQKLQARGKTKPQALVAVMRKLLHAIYGMFKHQEGYRGEKIYVLPAVADSTAAPAA
jgi:transposase